MRGVAGRAFALAVLALPSVAVVQGCRGEPTLQSSPTQATAGGPLASAAVPADHLAPDELVEGTKQAFGVVLPRDLQVDGSFRDVVFASGNVAIHPLVKYLRARVTEGSLREGQEAATFEHVHVPGGKNDLELTVHIAVVGPSARVELRDTTPKPQPNLPDDAARWRQAGLTPSGKLLDPTRIE
jgi:hypothetical protein